MLDRELGQESEGDWGKVGCPVRRVVGTSDEDTDEGWSAEWLSSSWVTEG